MQKILQVTADGSHTIELPELGVTYHSSHGAMAESRHVFIHAGLDHVLEQKKPAMIRILEIGFGTGLNALLSWQWARANAIHLQYSSIEIDPLLETEYRALNYGTLLNLSTELIALHQAPWNHSVELEDGFLLEKQQVSLIDFESKDPCQIIFFDAFSPVDQPELWTAAIFRKLYEQLSPGGLLLTYCSKTIVRKAMQEAGFQVCKIPGPRGKREMVRAIRLL